RRLPAAGTRGLLLPAITAALAVLLLTAIALLVSLQVAILFRAALGLLALLLAALPAMPRSALLCTHEASSL
ncbi:MAG TPA: hypothetical protein VLN42_07015, partial [Casimicrobiaceae bacterium]|nr:hypothetical protein [Casimicrobiaceae bacterium]